MIIKRLWKLNEVKIIPIERSVEGVSSNNLKKNIARDIRRYNTSRAKGCRFTDLLHSKKIPNDEMN